MNIISQIIEEKFPKSNHTLYMDELRIMTLSSEEMGTIHNEIKEIISGIGMEMNEKKSGMVLKNINKIPDGMQNIPIIEGEDLYKYLGVWQSDEINDTFNCKIIKEKMMKKMEEINTDESSNRSYITRINTEVIPIFRYSASVVNWKVTDLDRMDLEIRKYLRKAKYICCNSKDRLYVPIIEMGEGLISLSDEYVIELIITVIYYCTRVK